MIRSLLHRSLCSGLCCIVAGLPHACLFRFTTLFAIIEEDLSGPESRRRSIGFVWASFAGDQLDVDFPSGLFYRIKRGVLHGRGDYGRQSESFQDHTPLATVWRSWTKFSSVSDG
jgi:hypothetical protein